MQRCLSTFEFCCRLYLKGGWESVGNISLFVLRKFLRVYFEILHKNPRTPPLFFFRFVCLWLCFNYLSCLPTFPENRNIFLIYFYFKCVALNVCQSFCTADLGKYWSFFSDSNFSDLCMSYIAWTDENQLKNNVKFFLRNEWN